MDTITLSGAKCRDGEWYKATVELAKQSDGTWRATKFDGVMLDTYNASKSGASQSSNSDTCETKTDTQTRLADWEIAQLASKYNPRNMTRDQYDTFLDELVDKGALSRFDAMRLGYKGWRVLDLDPELVAAGKLHGGWVEVHDNKLKRTLEDAEGDLIVWLKSMMAQVDGASGENNIQKAKALRTLSDIVKRMQAAQSIRPCAV